MSSLVDVFTGPAGFVLELAERWRAGASGMLEVRRAGVTTLLYVDEGVPVFAESSGLSETLGRVLLREGKLDEAQYAQVVRRVTENLVDAEPMRFGEAAVSLGFVNAMQIQEALASQVRRRLLACAGPGPQERHWLQDASIVEDIGSYPQDVPKLIAILVEALTDEERAGLFRMLGQPSPREPLHEAASYYGLEPAEARALRPGQRLPEGHPLTLRLALLDAMTERVPLEPVPLEMFDADAPPTTARRPSARAPRPGVHVHTDIQTEEVLWAPRRAPPAQESGEVVLPMAPSPVSVEVADGASTTSEVIALPLPDFDVAPGDPVEARFAFVPPEGRRRADAASVEADSEGSASSDEGWRRDAASVEGRSEGGEEGWRREVASVEACSERSTPSEEDVTESTQVTRRADLPWTSPSGPSTDARTASARVADEEVATHAERLGAREDDERAGAPKREVATKELAARVGSSGNVPVDETRDGLPARAASDAREGPPARAASDAREGPPARAASDPQGAERLAKERARLLAQQLARRGVRLDSSEGPTRSPLFRPSIVAQKRRLVAEQSFRAGRTHLEGGRFEVAAKAFERARGLEDDPEIELHHLFARWRAGEAALGETLDRKAKEHLRRDPQSAFVPYVIAHRMLDAGDEERALKAFRRAAQLDPTLRDAERHARLLAMRLEK